MEIAKISSLSFDKVHAQTGLAVAQDEMGNTWIKGRISSSLVDQPLTLQIPSSDIINYDLYVFQNDRLLAVEKNIDNNGQEVRGRFPVYFFTANHPEYYLNIKAQSANTLKVVIKEPQHFLQSEWTGLMRNSLYYGLIIMAILFNIILYLIFGDKRFAIYSLLQLSLFLIFLYEDGMLYYISHGKWELRHFLTWALSVCATLSSIFHYYFLDLKQNMPYFKQIAIFITAGIFSSVLIYTWTDVLFFRHLTNIFIYSLPAICLYQAIKILKHDWHTRFLLLSFGILVLVILGHTLNKNIDSYFLSYFGINTLRLASTIEIIAISFMFSFKVRALRDKKKHYKLASQHHLNLLGLSRDSELIPLVSTAGQASFPTSSNVNNEDEDLMMEEIATHFNLTLREKEVLSYIWEGYSNKEISEKLCISINTTKYHISRLYAKLDVTSRSEARSLKENGVLQ